MPRGRRRTGQGSAVVDFVLVLVVLIPLFLGILQVALVLLVRNTLAAAASEGARYAATADRGPDDGVARTRSQIEGAISGRFAQAVRATPVVVNGAPGIEITPSCTISARSSRSDQCSAILPSAMRMRLIASTWISRFVANRKGGSPGRGSSRSSRLITRFASWTPSPSSARRPATAGGRAPRAGAAVVACAP